MIAFTFPGQGSQEPGMGQAWAKHPSWALVEQASDATGRDVAALLLDADAATLTETHNAQLATFVLSMVVHHAAAEAGHSPAFTAGHSLGEYSALCAAGTLDFDAAVQLVAERGEAMAVAAAENPGTMAAVLGLDDDSVIKACETVDGNVWVANFNAPGQVVIAGDPAAIERAADIARDSGAKRVMPLEVSGAFHTPFMAPAGERLAAALSGATFAAPSVPVVANVDAEAHDDAAPWPELLSRQLTSPVRWAQSVERLVGDGATTFVELGPGSVLTGTIKRIERSAGRVSISTPGDLEAAEAELAS